jgi:hypothetical protein
MIFHAKARQFTRLLRVPSMAKHREAGSRERPIPCVQVACFCQAAAGAFWQLRWTQGANQGYICSMAKRIHVFVADDSPALRRAVRTLLEAVPNIRVVGEAGDYAELLAKVDQAHADIA